MPRMKNKPSKRGRKGEGRPAWNPSPDEVAEAVKLAQMQCTLVEIAAWFGVSPSTIDRRMADDEDFASAIRSAWGKSAISFKRIVWKHADAGNSKALGLLASRFGWGEKTEHEHTVSGAAEKLRTKISEMLARVDAAEQAQSDP